MLPLGELLSESFHRHGEPLLGDFIRSGLEDGTVNSTVPTGRSFLGVVVGRKRLSGIAFGTLYRSHPVITDLAGGEDNAAVEDG